MHNNSRLRRLVLDSPLFLLVFAVLPGLLILSSFLHLKLPFHFTTKMLLANIICLLAFVAVRLFRNLSGLRRDIRYGVGRRRPSISQDLARPAAVVRADLEKEGYRFTGDGAYAEKADLGYPGTVLVYGGLFIVLAIGTWDNLAQFSGTFVHGIGKAAPLDRREIYYPLVSGPLSSIAGLPKLEITKLNFTDKEHPKGTVGIVLWSQDNKPLGTDVIVAMGDPYRYRGHDIFVSKLLVDAGLSIKTKDKNNREVIIFRDAVKLSPLWKKEGEYSFYGTFTDRANLDGELLYNPEKNVFKIKMSRDGKKVLETEFPFQVVLHKVEGDYDLSFIGVGRWAEIHVVRRRNMAMLWLGGIISALGLIMRIVFRPQRIWLEETTVGCRAWAVGGATKRRLKVEG
jgi:hypothetical protein